MSKRFLGLLLTLLLVLSLVPVSASAEGDAWKEFYVSTSGSDSGDGSATNPFKTLDRAREEVRKHNGNMQGNIVVNVAGGVYELEDELRFWVEDSGSNGFDVIYRGAQDAVPTISGGRRVTGWKQAENGLWTTTVPDAEFILDLFVDDDRAIQARSQKKVYGHTDYLAEGSYAQHSDGFHMSKSDMGLFKNPQDIRLHWPTTWKDYNYRVRDIMQDPKDENQVIVLLENPVWDQAYDYRGYGVVGQFDIGFIIENAYELLDEPGEFYFDKTTKVLTYFPREGEDMNTAEVYRAELDHILRVEGRDYHHKASHIRFENLRFAHGTYSMMDYASVCNQQGEVPVNPVTPAGSTPASVEVSYATNIDFEGCVFFGMNMACLYLSEDVSDSEVVGNVFSDLGSSAVLLGRWFIRNFEEPEDYNRAGNVLFRKGWTSSYNYVVGSGSSNMVFLNSPNNTEFGAAKANRIWRNEPWAKEEGICSWIKADLEDPFTIDGIMVSFETNEQGDSVSKEERSNIEILVSNDEDFKEYKVLATYGEDTPEVFTTEGAGEEKYQYVMIRKTVPGPFAITGMEVYSYDREPIGCTGTVQGIKVENNSINRVATIHTQAPAILAHSVNSCSISHNEIKDTGYQGIAVGWAFDNFSYCYLGNNKINHNRIDNVMMQTDDGGAIYMMNWQPDTEYVGNYISNVINMVDGYYFEEGSYFMEIRDSVILNTHYPLFFWSAGNRNIPHAVTVKNTWADNYDALFSAGDYFFDSDPIQPFSNSNMPDDVIRIMAEAGIEEEYEYIKERVPDNECILLRGPETFESQSRTCQGYASPRGKRFAVTARNIVKTGSFGELPWQYDPALKFELTYWADRMDSGKNKADDYSSGHILEQCALWDAIEATYDSATHLSLEEMQELCRKAMETEVGKGIGMISAEAMASFKKKVEEAEKLPAGTKVEKAVVVNRLEIAYEAFYNALQNADILACYVPDVETVIDAETKTVTLKTPIGHDFSEQIPQFVVSANAEVGLDLSKFKPADGAEIPVHNKLADEFVIWKLRIAEKADEEKELVLTDGSLWNNPNYNTELPTLGDKLVVQPWYEASMCTAPLDGKLSFTTKASAVDTDKGIHYIFAAKTADLEMTGLYPQNTYYELVIKGDDAIVNRVDAGVTTELTTVKRAGFLYGEDNRIDISVTTEGQLDRLVVRLNGATIINKLLANPIGQSGYFGVYSAHQPVTIGA